jgi:hypothetical protein
MTTSRGGAFLQQITVTLPVIWRDSPFRLRVIQPWHPISVGDDRANPHADANPLLDLAREQFCLFISYVGEHR